MAAKRGALLPRNGNARSVSVPPRASTVSTITAIPTLAPSAHPEVGCTAVRYVPPPACSATASQLPLPTTVPADEPSAYTASP